MDVSILVSIGNHSNKVLFCVVGPASIAISNKNKNSREKIYEKFCMIVFLKGFLDL